MPADGESGQATVESLAAVGVLLGAGAVALQILAVGYSGSLADGAAEAGAMAIAAGRPPAPAVRAALPGWARGRVALSVSGGRVTVRIAAPTVLPTRLPGVDVESSAWARPPAGGTDG